MDRKMDSLCASTSYPTAKYHLRPIAKFTQQLERSTRYNDRGI